MLDPEDFPGPLALVTGPATDQANEFALGLLARYGSPKVGLGNTVCVTRGDQVTRMPASEHSRAEEAVTISNSA